MQINNPYSPAQAGPSHSVNSRASTVAPGTQPNTESTQSPSSFAALLAAQMETDNAVTKPVNAPGAITATSGKSSIELQEVDVGNLLTDEDKHLTGWPGSQPNWSAIYIALDRKDGSLQGPVTRDYLVGNPELNIVGLAERSQGEGGITSSIVDQMLERLAG